jgi:hypothetical protein
VSQTPFSAFLPSFEVKDGLRLALTTLEASLRVTRFFPPARALLGQEVENKILSLQLFYCAQDELGLAGSGKCVEEAARLVQTKESFLSIWMMEGAAYLHARSTSSIRCASVPEQHYVPLHAGAGMAFAESAVDSLPARPGRQDISRFLDGFLSRCRDNARAGWEDAMFEPLGLIVRLKRPDLLRVFANEAGAVSPHTRALFWHGSGRGLYFSPGAMTPLPDPHGRALDTAFRDAAEPGDKENTVAGYCWAVTLVNLRYPDPVSSLLTRCVELGVGEPFSNGFVSALMVWKHMVPSDELWGARYTQPFSGAKSPQKWEDLAAAPARAAFSTILPGLLKNNAVAQLFAFHTPAGLRQLAGVAA